MRKPPRLRSGSRVALISPAGPIDDARLTAALAMCETLGLEPVVGSSATARTGYLAGADDARAADLQHAIDDDAIDAIWALRGGYGTVRLLSQLNFEPLRARPKPYIGFSDNTAIHLALASTGVVAFHAPHAGGDFPAFAEESFRRVLFDASEPVYLDTPANEPMQMWQRGVARGRLIGGNLALLAAAEGTPFSMRADDAIVFIEDIGEAPYRVDRLIMQLMLSGAMDRVAGVIVGQFTECSDATGDALDVVREELSRLSVPIIANAPIGHVPNNWTLPIGTRVQLDADNARVTLLEAAVTD